MSRFLLGIDPGRNTGIAIIDRDKKKLVKLDTLNFWETVKVLDDFTAYIYPKDDMIGFVFEASEIQLEVVIEDPNENSFIYNQNVAKLSKQAAMTVAQSVGRNKEQAFLLIDYLEKKGIKYKTVRPRNRNNGGGKWTSEYFCKMTGWQGKSNEHNRDAARLIWGL